MQFSVAFRTLTNRIISRPPAAILFSTRPQTTSYGFSCLGWDGRPLRGGAGDDETGEKWLDEEEENGDETEDYRKCYEKRKPSPAPLSRKMEFADGRKPIIGATGHVGDEKEFLLVRETVDDALRRAEEMWRAARVRGDPDSPQARALARMLRERYNNGEEYGANIAYGD